jgi:hypothetical protein
VFLQRAWDKYGEGDFDFRVLEECPPEHVRVREQHYMDTSDHELLYNIALDAHRGAGKWGRLGAKWSEDQRAKFSLAMKGRPSPIRGTTHNRGPACAATWLSKSTTVVVATHMDGRELRFSCTNEATVALSLKRKTISNILNGLSKKTRSGWSFRYEPK